MLQSMLRRLTGLQIHLLFIGAVSAYDAWLVVDWADEILCNERNLVGRYLIQLTNGDVTLFLSCKVAGTIGALTFLAWLGRHYHHIAMPVARSMSIFQLWLLWFLTCSVTVDPLMPVATGGAAASIGMICLWPMVSAERFDVRMRRLRVLMARHSSRRRRAQRKAQLVAG